MAAKKKKKGTRSTARTRETGVPPELEQFLRAVLENENHTAEKLRDGDFAGALRSSKVKLPAAKRRAAIDALSRLKLADLKRLGEVLFGDHPGWDEYN